MSQSISLSTAKARLSAVVREAGSTDAEYVITVRGVPTARIVPIPKRAARDLRGFGALKTDRPPMPPEEMHREWGRAAGSSAAC